MEKMRLFLKYLYKFLVQHSFKLFYGKISCEKTNSFNENIIIDVVKNESILKPDNSKYNIYKITNGRDK